MHVPRPTDDDKDNFRLLLGDFQGVEVKAMFANLGAFINGTGTYGPAERPMGGWISLPPTWSAHPPLARE